MKTLSIFEKVAMKKVSRNKFDLSHDVKMSFNMGDLIPMFCEEVIPGDIFRINPTVMLRFAPLVAPVMHRVNVVVDFYFVPNRILWSEWEKFITGGDTGTDNPVHPYIQFEADKVVAIGSLADYLGIPTGTVGEPFKVNPLPFAAYVKIWDEFYRDQNLMDGLYDEYTLTSGDNPDYLDFIEAATLLKRSWERDYLTSALPYAQKGDSVQIPLVSQDNLPVEFMQDTAADPVWRDPSTSTLRTGSVTGQNPGGNVLVGGQEGAYDPDGSLAVDVQAGATNIETLRRAFRLQEWLEKQARAGTRYIESILAHFGVRSSDARLQRPEFIGRSRQNMVISEVLSTADTANAPVGQMAGHGISVGGGSFSYSAEEHGWIIGLVNVQPTTAYQDGLARKFQRFDKFDYAWPTFANLGEQSITKAEVRCMVPAGAVKLTDTWGYIPRYSEYKFSNNRVAGEMRDSLDFWHLGRKFASSNIPLNEDFLLCNPSYRIFAVTDPHVHHVYAHIFNQCTALRKLPVFGIPTI